MICNYFSGRTGNQMFQYAFVRKLREIRENRDSLVFNFSLLSQHKTGEKDYKDTFEDFYIVPYTINNNNLVLKFGSFRQRFLYFVFQFEARIFRKFFNKSKWFRRFSKEGLLFSEYNNHDYAQYAPLIEGKEPTRFFQNLIVYGKFENPEFFQGIKPILQQEFTPKYPPLESNKELYNIIKQNNTVCVHVRRGDFLSDEFRKDFYVCDEHYYHKAIELIKQKVENPIFFFCSNDINWVRDTLKIDSPCYYEPEGNPLWETFRMMYTCKHFVISNSTLSWWAQYVCKNESKIVVSPDHWYNNPEMNKNARLIQPAFVKVETCYH